MEVVMGIQPELPATLRAGLMVEAIGVSEYVQMLMDHLKETHRKVRECAAAAGLEREGEDEGDRGATGLMVGDLVALKRSGADKPVGSKRFQWSTDGRIYKIKEVLGENTYSLLGLLDDAEPVSGNTRNRFSAERLVKLDLPEYQPDVGADRPKALEIYDDASGDWIKGKVEKLAVDGRTLIRLEGDPETSEWMDLTKCRYRWLLEEATPNAVVPVAAED